MPYISPRAMAALLLTVVLPACGISVEQPPGVKVAAGAQLAGNWDTTIALKGAQRGTLAIKPDAEELIVQWSGQPDGGAARAAMFQLKDRHYLALNQGTQPGGYFIVRVEETSRDRVRLRALDGERAATLLREMKLPVVYRPMWLHQELFLDKAAFQTLMAQHPDALFANGALITLDKVP